MTTDTVHADNDWDTTVAEHKQRQLLHIGRVASELITRDGLTSVSMSTLARAAGVSRATLYNYVPDVATAIHLYLKVQTDTFHTRVAAAVAEEHGPEAQLRRYIREQVAYVAGADHRAAVALAEAGDAVTGPNCPPGPRRTVPAVLQKIIDDGVTTGVFTPAAAGVQATLITRLLYTAHELLHQQHLSQADAATAITDLILDGIHPRESAPPRPRTATGPRVRRPKPPPE
jgi:AcrR family transcriptional regulator